MSTGMEKLTVGSYWTGIAMSLVCFTLILAGNTELVWPFEHRGFPLSWAFGCAAVLAFLAYEFCPSELPRRRDIEEREEPVSQFAPAWESVESMYD
jgi:hypothetical protein